MPRRKDRPKITGKGFVIVDMDNPDYQPGNDGASANPRKAPVFINPAESPIGWMLVHGNISYSQARAGDEFRKHYEIVQGGALRSADYAREPVDGGKTYNPYTQSRKEASENLARAHQILGQNGFNLVEQVCGMRMHLKDIAAQSGRRKNWRYIKRLGKELRDKLDILAEEYNFA